VREKEVREDAIWPVREAGVLVGGVEERRERSLRRECDCLRAELKREF
jgi:hypothetical protein